MSSYTSLLHFIYKCSWTKLVDRWLHTQQKTKSSDRGQSPWPCLCPFKRQTVAEASVGRLSRS